MTKRNEVPVFEGTGTRIQIAKSRAGFCFAAALGVFVTTDGFCATTQTPRAIVEEYCSLDARGADFSSSNPNAEVIWRLLINGDDAGYDRAVIIRSYHVGEPTVGKSGEDVVVTYDDLGFISAGQLEREKRSETVTFHLTKVGETWKIDGLRLLPHISEAWLLSDFRIGLDADQLRRSEPFKELSRW